MEHVQRLGCVPEIPNGHKRDTEYCSRLAATLAAVKRVDGKHDLRLGVDLRETLEKLVSHFGT